MPEGRESERRRRQPPASPPAAYRVRLPGFVAGREVGLGDVIKKVTGTFGIRPCGGCQRRAAALNRWMSFRGDGGGRR